MSLKEKNLECIRLGFPELYERLQSGTFALDATQVAFEETVTRPALFVQTEGEEVVRMNSIYNPDHEAAIWIQGQQGLQEKNLFLFGLGNGSFGHALLNGKGMESKVLIYEPSANVFMMALECCDLREFFSIPGVRVIVEGINDDMASGVMEEMLTLDNYESRQFFVSPQCEVLFPDIRKKWVKIYMDGVGVLMSNRNTVRRFIHISPYNQLLNLKYLKRGYYISDIAAVWQTEVPVALVGAGPSLEENIETLRERRNQMFLFAVDSALPYLLSKDIIPEAYICIEADKPMDFFQDERAFEIPMFCKVDTTYHLLEKHNAPKIFGYDEPFVMALYEKYHIPLPAYRYGGNGATSLFAICKELGVENVILVGQDMAYTNGHGSHAGGRDEGYDEENKFRIPGNNGDMVMSRQDWYRFVKWYENAIPVMNYNHVINTAENGALVKGTECMTLNQALDRYGKSHKSVHKILTQVSFPGVFGKLKDLEKLYYEWEEELVQIDRICKRNPKDEKRKKYDIYFLVKLYEEVNEKDSFDISQKDGIKKLNEYLKQCIREVAKHGLGGN